MRRSEQEILEIVYRRSGQIRMRRHMLQVLAGAVAALLMLTAAPSFVRQLSVQKLNTADQPETVTTSDKLAGEAGDEKAGGGAQTTKEGGPLAPGAGHLFPGPSPGTQSSSSGKGSGSGGSLPAGKIPVGLEIAFNRESDIYLMKTDGTSLRKLTSGVAPGWSPDGKRIAFSDGDLRLINADGSYSQSLGTRGSFPTWSPDGERLAFNWPCDAQTGTPCDSQAACGAACGIGIVARDGTRVQRLGTGLWPDWGPNGRIVFTDGVQRPDCHNQGAVFAGEAEVETPECALQLWVMNPDGSGRTMLPIPEAIMPTWSPDGSRIAYYTSGTSGGVFVANADGTGSVNFAPAGYMHPAWSPDGLWLALTRRRPQPGCAGCGHYLRIYVRAIDGSNERQLTLGPSDDMLPAFSPQR